jgi:hypothetical protein
MGEFERQPQLVPGRHCARKESTECPETRRPPPEPMMTVNGIPVMEQDGGVRRFLMHERMLKEGKRSTRRRRTNMVLNQEPALKSLLPQHSGRRPEEGRKELATSGGPAARRCPRGTTKSRRTNTTTPAGRVEDSTRVRKADVARIGAAHQAARQPGLGRRRPLPAMSRRNRRTLLATRDPDLMRLCWRS